MGGPSGGCIPSSLVDTCVTYEDINKTGAIVGSGGMIVMDENTCMVDMARYFLDFTRKESCGKCNYCRIGTLRMLEILERITRGEGDVYKRQDEDTYDEFRKNGTAHVLAVSGLHIGILYMLFKKFFGKRPNILATAIFILLLFIYGTISMWSVSVTRACLLYTSYKKRSNSASGYGT